MGPAHPLAGSIWVRVWTGTASAAVPMEGVWVLVGDREAVTDSDGRWSLERVPAGTHGAHLDRARLPADLDPAGTAIATVAVRPSREATADFPLRRLGTIAGRIAAGNPGMRLAQVVLRLEPGGAGLWLGEARHGRFEGCRQRIMRSRSTAPTRAWRWGHAALVDLETGAELEGTVFEVAAIR